MNRSKYISRTVMTDQRVRTLIREQAPEYIELLDMMSEEDQNRLIRAANNLMGSCNNMGIKGAMELLLKLGQLMVKNPQIIRTKNRQN